MLHFAYGSNLSKAAMRTLCPAAVALDRATLPGHRLIFRSWADIEPGEGGVVAGALWRITPACLEALDLYEDVAGGLYRRSVLPVVDRGGTTASALVYRMTGAAVARPDPDYLAVVRQGYRDFGLDEAMLLAAAA